MTNPTLPLLGLAVVLLSLLLFTRCEQEDPEVGDAILCDYICTSDQEGVSKCEWYCEDPEVQVSCNFCEYEVHSGSAYFDCTQCDVGTY